MNPIDSNDNQLFVRQLLGMKTLAVLVIYASCISDLASEVDLIIKNIQDSDIQRRVRIEILRIESLVTKVTSETPPCHLRHFDCPSPVSPVSITPQQEIIDTKLYSHKNDTNRSRTQPLESNNSNPMNDHGNDEIIVSLQNKNESLNRAILELKDLLEEKDRNINLNTLIRDEMANKYSSLSEKYESSQKSLEIYNLEREKFASTISHIMLDQKSFFDRFTSKYLDPDQGVTEFTQIFESIDSLLCKSEEKVRTRLMIKCEEAEMTVSLLEKKEQAIINEWQERDSILMETRSQTLRQNFELTTENNVFKDEILSLKLSLQKLTEQNLDITNENSSLKSDFLQGNDSLKNLQMQLELANEKGDELLNQLDKATEVNSHLQSEIELLKNNTFVSEEMCVIITKLEQKIADLELINNELEYKLKTGEEHILILKKEIDSLKLNVIHSSNELETVVCKNQDLSTKLDVQHSQSEGQSSDRMELLNRLLIASKAIQESSIIIERLESQTRDDQSRVQDLNSKIILLETQIDGLRLKSSDDTSQIANLSSKCLSLESVANDLNFELTEYQRKLNIAESKIKSESVRYSQQINSLRVILLKKSNRLSQTRIRLESTISCHKSTRMKLFEVCGHRTRLRKKLRTLWTKYHELNRSYSSLNNTIAIKNSQKLDAAIQTHFLFNESTTCSVDNVRNEESEEDQDIVFRLENLEADLLAHQNDHLEFLALSKAYENLKQNHLSVCEKLDLLQSLYNTLVNIDIRSESSEHTFKLDSIHQTVQSTSTQLVESLIHLNHQGDERRPSLTSNNQDHYEFCLENKFKDFAITTKMQNESFSTEEKAKLEAEVALLNVQLSRSHQSLSDLEYEFETTKEIIYACFSDKILKLNELLENLENILYGFATSEKSKILLTSGSFSTLFGDSYDTLLAVEDNSEPLASSNSQLNYTETIRSLKSELTFYEELTKCLFKSPSSSKINQDRESQISLKCLLYNVKSNVYKDCQSILNGDPEMIEKSQFSDRIDSKFFETIFRSKINSLESLLLELENRCDNKSPSDVPFQSLISSEKSMTFKHQYRFASIFDHIDLIREEQKSLAYHLEKFTKNQQSLLGHSNPCTLLPSSHFN